MVEPLYSARLKHLTYALSISVECLSCGHNGKVTVVQLRAHLSESYRVTELRRVLSCEHCRAKGRAIVDARKALGYDRLN